MYRLEKPAPDPTFGMVPNTIGGYSGNVVASGVVGATIGGGGTVGQIQQVNGTFGTLGGGTANTVGGFSSTIGGGQFNFSTGVVSTVGGGEDNSASGNYSIVTGGQSNKASGLVSTVGGGYGNVANTEATTVSGGNSNTASGYATTIGGGVDNTASAPDATISGGVFHTASGESSVIGGGYQNTASGILSVVAGGQFNTASGYNSTVAGGNSNTAAGDYSFAAGWRAKANHSGSFVWGDFSTNTDITSSANNEMTIRAAGGVRFYTKSDLSTGLTIAPNGSQWLVVSDRNMKNHFRTLDSKQVLDKFSKLPITEWSYKAQDPSIRHIGPMAQDFYQAFGLGEDKLRIGTMDADGVMMAAIQGLNAKLSDKDKQITSLKAENRDLKQRLADIEARLSRLERLAPPATTH
jgi:hypothetical protein